MDKERGRGREREREREGHLLIWIWCVINMKILHSKVSLHKEGCSSQYVVQGDIEVSSGRNCPDDILINGLLRRSRNSTRVIYVITVKKCIHVHSARQLNRDKTGAVVMVTYPGEGFADGWLRRCPKAHPCFTIRPPIVSHPHIARVRWKKFY